MLTGREDLEHLLPRFTGSIEQVPPMYSAIKIGGQKLYQIARRGGEIQRPARPVTVYELELLDQTGPGDYTLRIRCSKGTYVRTLCHDIGQALGCGGNPFTVRQPLPEGLYRVYGLEGEFLCLSRLEGGVMTSLKNFFGA